VMHITVSIGKKDSVKIFLTFLVKKIEIFIK